MIYSNGATTTGVKLAANASAWSSLSDVNNKENVRDFRGGDLLAGLATMSIREWNDKSQDASIRHVGPTTQDSTPRSVSAKTRCVSAPSTPMASHWRA
jgi:hypothetical protein